MLDLFLDFHLLKPLEIEDVNPKKGASDAECAIVPLLLSKL